MHFSDLRRSVFIRDLLPPAGFAAFLTLARRLRIMHFPHADVAELADAQVSEACDGDIVEVQVLSSAPEIRSQRLGVRSHGQKFGPDL